MIKVKKILGFFFLILIVGGLGGILADRFFLPFLGTIRPFNQWQYFQNGTNGGTTIINPTERITITENVAIEEAIEGVESQIVVVQSLVGTSLLNQTTGFIVTSDGLILTSSAVIHSRANNYLVLKGGEYEEASLVKKDLKSGLALFQIEGNNLPVATLINLEDLRLGQRLFLVGANLVQKELNLFVNWGIVRSINQNSIMMNLEENDNMANGSPLINVKGEVVGLNIVLQKKYQKTIPSYVIREFMGM